LNANDILTDSWAIENAPTGNENIGLAGKKRDEKRGGRKVPVDRCGGGVGPGNGRCRSRVRIVQ